MTWKKTLVIAAAIVMPLGGLALATYLAMRRMTRGY